MPRSSSLLMLLPWRLGWLLATLLWAVEFRLPMVDSRSASVGAILHTGSSHPNAVPAAMLLTQCSFNREAVAPAGVETGSWQPVDVALPPQFGWQLASSLVWPTWLRPACTVLPARFRQVLLLGAVLPNAP